MRIPRRRGPPPAPIARLTNDARRAIEASPLSKTELARLCRFDSLQTFSAFFHHEFRATPLTLQRLACLGEMFRIDRVYEEVGR